MKTAIVTGAYGYIGSVLCALLKAGGYYVVGVDNDHRAQEDWLANNHRTSSCDEYICDDFASQESLQAIRTYKDAVIFHLAANSLLGPSAYDPLSYFENNTAKTLKLIQNLKPTQRLVFASTAAVYAETDKPVKETSKIAPPNNYGLSKLWCEQMIDKSYEILKLKATSFRFFNVIGAYDGLGQLPETPHIINQLCDRSMMRESFKVNGTDFPTADGTCVRDYVSVIDICRAMIHADEHMKSVDAPMHEKYNLGTHHGNSVKEVVDIFRKTCYDVDVEYVGRRVGDPPFLVANPSKFIKDTGFTYKFSDDLEQMIKSAWDYRSNEQL